MGRTSRRRSKPKRRRVDQGHSSADMAAASTSSSAPVDNEPSCSATKIPEFDPSVDKPRIDLWLDKVNETAAILQWDEAQIIQSAMSKLNGEARRWYQSQTCGLRSWERWQALLSKAFPRETEYPELLAMMLNRRYKVGEDIEEYYYDKMSLLYACDISGRNAVDCVIHGIEDTTISELATLAYFTDPDDLFAYLKEISIEQKDVKVTRCA